MTETSLDISGSSATTSRVHSDLRAQRIRSAWVFLAPTLIVLALVAGWPLLRTIYLSFTNASLTSLGTAEFVGFNNYLSWVTLKSGRTVYRGLLADPAWWGAVWNTIRFTILSVSLETIFGLIVALVLNANFRGRGLVRAAILIPWAIPTIVSAKMWGWMLNDQFGILNHILLNLGLISQKIAWTANPDTAMVAILIVDVWKTTPFMALLILAGLQMVPSDIYEAAKIDGVHPVKVFWRVTLPLIRPALMVAIIFRMLDALRIFDLIYVLTPNNAQTKTMSVFARENLFDFDKFAYGAAASTMLFLIIAAITVLYMFFGRVNVGSRGNSMMHYVKTLSFYLLVAFIILIAVFPFYYAIITSLKSGTALFQVDYWPSSFSLDNYAGVLTQGSFLRSLGNSLLVATVVVAISLLLAVTAAYALARVSFRGRGLLLLTILSVSMFPQIAVLAGLFELIRFLGIFNTPLALIFSYMIFTLPFTVWVLTTFMRDLPIEIEEAAIVDGASPWVIITRVFMPLMWPALVTTGLLAFISAWNEFLFALTFTSSGGQRTVPVAIALLSGSSQFEIPWGNIMAASVIVTVPLVILVLIFQRRIVSGLTAGGVKG